MTQAMLPLWGRTVIFVDWHGVLSHDLFWTSILADPRHPLHSPLEEKLAEVFARDKPTAHEWMKGQHSSTDIISGMRLDLPKRYGDGYLERKLNADFLDMRINTDLVAILGQYRPDALIVVATDNMDCFAEAFARSQRRRRYPSKSGISQFATCVASCDDIICSSQVGTLKSEDPAAFFGPWLERRGLRFADAVLIDDRTDNCAAFTEQGGTALHWKLGTNPVSNLDTLLRDWFDRIRTQPAQVAAG